MAENVTTLLEKWQKQQQDHPEWTPALEDILYVNHGSGSDRDRLYSLEQVRDLIQGLFELIHMEKNGSELDADGEKLTVTKSTQGGDYTAKLDKDGMIVGFPTIGYIRYGLRNIEFLAADGTTKVGEFSLDNGKFKLDKSVDVTGDVNASGDLSATGKVVSSGKEVNSYGNTVPSGGSYFKLAENDFIIASATGASGRSVFRVQLNGSAYDVIGVGGLSANRVASDVHAVGDGWEVAKSGNDLAFKKVGSGGTATSVARFVGNDLEMLAGYIRGKNTILATSNVDLTSSAYSSIAAGTELTVVNDGSTTISVTYASGATAENIAASTARKYVKKTSGFAKMLALDPTATHP